MYTSDCVKFYRQIAIHPDDRHLLRILFSDSTGQLVEYELTTNTYGTSAAQWLALRSVNQLIMDEGSRYPRAARVVANNKYIDDYLFGADDIEELERTKTELIQFLQAGGMELAKWASNFNHQAETAIEPVVFKESEGIPTLGVSWSPSNDTFAVSVQLRDAHPIITKRTVLSETSTIFDFLGTKAPVTVRAKVFLQDLWLAGIPWDQPLTGRLLQTWLEIRADLEQLPLLDEQRWLETTPRRKLQVHGFSDASARATAAVVYFRSEDESGIFTSLAICKTKVAPIKTITIPKLELSAAHFLAQLLGQLREYLDLQHAEFFAWSDAKVALAWIKSHPSRWKPFVANRVAQIQEITDASIWSHVATDHNPADLAPRGMSPLELQRSSLWKSGPSWLSQPQAAWPVYSQEGEEPVVLEMRANALLHAVATEAPEWDLFTKYPTLQKLIRIVTLLRLFGENCRRKTHRRRLMDVTRAAQEFVLRPAHLRAGLCTLVRISQAHDFPSELASLREGRNVPSRSPLLKLRPRLGSDGCIRIGGRLQRSDSAFDEKHPWIVSRRSHLARLLVQDAHERTMHGGSQLTQRQISTNFWILHGRSLVRQIVRSCVKCARFGARPMQQSMSQLPQFRLRPQRPFLDSGVDFAGPIRLRTTAGRGHKAFKGYISLFICPVTKAIHLEVAVDLSTQGFLSAFRRFISRRGRCARLHSDNGTNFRGASVELKALFNEASTFYKKCAAAIAKDGTDWTFNPPSAPHFGGIWEAGVKSAKHHLRRVIGDTTLTFEEMSTLLAQIEACLNSRPLTPLSTDPQDLSALTPGHFLVGEPLTAIPEPPVPENFPPVKRYLLVTKMRNDFWVRWRAEYLHQLQVLTKWDREKEPLQVGQIVLIKDELLPATKWAMARVTKTFPDEEGAVRTVELRTAAGSLLRPIHKLIKLPVVQDP